MAATVHTWTNGNADGDWNNGANWDTAAVPGAGGVGVDTAIFDGSVTQTGPSVNMDRTADNVLYQIIVRPNFTGDIGGAGNALIHSLDTGTNARAHLLHRGTGATHFSITAAKLGDVIMDGSGTLDLDCESDAAYVGILCIKAGTVRAASTCGLKYYVVLDGVTADLTVAAKNGAEHDPDWIVMRTGTFLNHRVITADGRAVVFGGKLDQRGLVADSAVLIAGPAGRITYTPDGTLGAGHNPDVLVLGLLDGRGSNQDIAPARLIVGQLGAVLGSSIQLSSAYVDIDLREEYP